eukprot:TRINITY_DN10414_c0_g1_i1.p1 TRINITY_DN10414_c0_g1~~TRINITY_DN10414_c0_g1_i1.p1  ORF type:complete len:641 (+),score=95.21 TRINITY_DN10414_c0_g1_i1:135-1925(+)
MDHYGFRLPRTPLLPNDKRLTIQSLGNNIIFEEPVKESPRVVERSFMISEFQYRPPQKESICQLQITLQPTVNISGDTNDISIFLPGFRNSLSKVNIHIMGEDRFRIENSMAEWNETTATLLFKVPRRQVIPAFEMLDLRIEESQGFILPAALNANDTKLQIASRGNIISEPIKKSPMVGNGPYKGHLFCAFQYETGVRTPDPICPTAVDCNPPLTDPCNPQELFRCGCTTRVDQIFPLKISGFNLQQADEIYFLPYETLCSMDALQVAVLNPFMAPSSQSLAAGRDSISYDGIKSIKSGVYRICVKHTTLLYDVGKIVVRPSCKVPLVMVDGSCVQHCPKTKVPIAGECLRDEKALVADDHQAFMLTVKMADPYELTGTGISDRPSSDPEQKYFKYRFVYEMAKILNADPTRIKVASLGNGSVLVHTIFEVVGTYSDIIATEERSPHGLISLFRALQADTSSNLYKSPFFKYIDRQYVPTAIPVRKCVDGVFRVFCPYDGSIFSTTQSSLIFFLGSILVPVVMAIVCWSAWNLDMEKGKPFDDRMIDKIKKDYTQVEPKLQLEYANSWLEGRFVGEDWQTYRKALENHLLDKPKK